MPKTLKISCETKDSVALSELIEFQGDLKVLTDSEAAKLRAEIETTGFAFPIYVWKDPKDKKKKILGGHQRVRVLRLMEKDGYTIPSVPVVYIQAKNEQEAKNRILQDVSQYGEVSKQGLFNFMQSNGINLEMIATRFHIPEIDIPEFKMEFFPPAGSTDKGEPTAVNYDAYLDKSIKPITLYYSAQDYEKIVAVLDQLLQKTGCTEYSSLIWRLVSEKVPALKSK